MTHAFPSTSPARRRATARDASARSSRGRTRPRLEHRDRARRALGGYIDGDGRARELIARSGAAGSTLVLDRDRATREDVRLVAHLAADEPTENAAVVCASYLEQAAAGGGRCRALTPEDTTVVPFADQRDADVDAQLATGCAPPADGFGRRYSLEPVQGGLSIPELRWCRQPADGALEREPVSLREAIAALESYEPLRALTLRALALHHGSEVSTTVLRAELARTQQSPIVLNRGLREAVLAVVADGVSMSEIAIRCGRVKHDRRGNESGETSWLARRLGILPEGGQSTPTRWIHSDVLGLIARRGLGISPREVEL